MLVYPHFYCLVVDEWAVGIARTIQNILEKAVVPIRNQLAADGPILQTLELAKDLRKLLDDPVEFSDDLSLMNVSANPPEQPVILQMNWDFNRKFHLQAGPANGQNGNRGNVGAQWVDEQAITKKEREENEEVTYQMTL